MIISKYKIILLSVAVILFCATGLSYSEYGWSDSGPFTGYFLSFPPEGPVGWGDSDNFPVWLLSIPESGTNGWQDIGLSLDLRNIDRTWADSDSFSFDCLSNSQPVNWPPRLPPPFSVVDLLEQYDSANDRWVSPVLSCPSAGQPVIVLNHGWNSSTETLLSLARAISNRIPGIHIYAWHWGEGEHEVSPANPNGKSTGDDFKNWSDCVESFGGALKCLVGDIPLKNELLKSMTNAVTNGDRLGDSLFAHGIRPNLHKIHLIGSSFGGVVSAVAAQTLSAKKCGKVQQITTLDTPALIFPNAVKYIEPQSAERVEVLYYDWVAHHLKGAFGGALKTNASNVLNFELNPSFCLECSIFNYPHILHFFVSDWYKDSIINSNSICENEYGFGWSVSLNPTGWHWDDWPLGNKEETTDGEGCLTHSTERVTEDFFAADKKVDNFNSAASWISNGPQAAQLVLDGQWNSAVNLLLSGSRQQLQGEKLTFAKMDLLTDSNDSYIYKEVNIPAGTDLVALDVRFSAAGEGDKLTLSVGDEILIVVDACAVGVSETYQTYYASVSGYAGQTAIVQIALRALGTGQTVALVDNLRFTTLTLVEDVTGDKAVDYADLSVLAQNWLIVGCNFRNNCDGADIDRDNKVDFADFARLASYWLESF